MAARTDVTDEAGARELVDGVVAKHGRLDALVNTVGGYTGGATLWEVDPDALDRMLALNLKSGYALARAAVPAMLKQRTGVDRQHRGEGGRRAPPGGAAVYAASKAAALALMDSLAADLAGTGVRVNSVLPSIIDTEANRKAMPKADFAKWPKPEDIARVILFLCSADAKVDSRRVDSGLRQRVTIELARGRQRFLAFEGLRLGPVLNSSASSIRVLHPAVLAVGDSLACLGELRVARVLVLAGFLALRRRFVRGRHDPMPANVLLRVLASSAGSTGDRGGLCRPRGPPPMPPAA